MRGAQVHEVEIGSFRTRRRSRWVGRLGEGVPGSLGVEGARQKGKLVEKRDGRIYPRGKEPSTGRRRQHGEALQKTVLWEEYSSSCSRQGERNGPSSRSFAHSFGLKRPSAARGAYGVACGMSPLSLLLCLSGPTIAYVEPNTGIGPAVPMQGSWNAWGCSVPNKYHASSGPASVPRHTAMMASCLLIYVDCRETLSRGEGAHCAGILHNVIDRQNV